MPSRGDHHFRIWWEVSRIRYQVGGHILVLPKANAECMEEALADFAG